MRKFITVILVLGIFVLLGLYLYEKNKSPIYIDSPVEIVEKPDTSTRYRVIKPVRPYKEPSLPKKVIEYQVIKTRDTRQLNKMRLKILEDSIYIRDLENKISIHENYLKLYPENPKLIDFSLDYNSLNLSLLNTDGNFYENRYPINTLQNKYRWTNDGLTSKSINSPLNKLQFYGGGSLDIWSFSPVGTFRIERTTTRKRYYIHTQMVLFSRDRSNIQIGVEYKLGK